MEINCFAFAKKDECKILNDNRNCGSGCPFRKTVAEADESVVRSNARLRSLPIYQQTCIAGTYYRGKMPWAKGGDEV